MALARLHQPQAGQPVLESTLASLDPEVIKTRPRLMAALAPPMSARATSTRPAVSEPQPWTWPPASRWHPNLQDLRRRRLDLEPWGKTRAVRELDDQLALAG